MINLWTTYFNIFQYDVFYFMNDVDVANFVEDTTPYGVSLVISELEKLSTVLLKLLVITI